MVTMDLLGDDGLLDLRKRGARTDPEEVVREEREARGRSDLPGMNRALEELARQRSDAPGGRPERPADAQPPATTGQGSRSGGPGPLEGLCHVCRSRKGIRDCQGCGKPVCAADHWLMFGLCRTCASEDRVRRWQRGSEVSDVNWLADEDAGPETDGSGPAAPPGGGQGP